MTFQLHRLLSISPSRKLARPSRLSFIQRMLQQRNRGRIRNAILALFADSRRFSGSGLSANRQSSNDRHVAANSLSYKYLVGEPYRRLLAYEGLEQRQLLAVVTWDGGGSDNNWTTAANWVGDVAPQANDDLVFPLNAARKSNTNNFAAGTDFGSIRIEGEAYALAGNQIDLVKSFEALRTNNTFSIPLKLIGNTPEFKLTPFTLAGTSTVTVSGTIDLNGKRLKTTTDASTTLIFSGTISGPSGLDFFGSGNAVLAAANSYTDTTIVNGGKLILRNALALGPANGNQGESTTINTGATLRLENNITVREKIYTGSGDVSIESIGNNILEDQIQASGTLRLRPATSSALTINGKLDVLGNGTAFFIEDGGKVILTNSQNKASDLRIIGNSELQLTGDLQINGSTEIWGTLSGNGTLKSTANNYVTNFFSGILNPGVGSSAGKLEIANLSLNSPVLTTFYINGTTAGSNHDQVSVNGTVSLDGTLSLTRGASNLNFNSTITLVSNDGNDAITGTFYSYPEGAIIVADNEFFRISYVGGDGNDVTVTKIAVSTWDGKPDAGGNSANANWMTASNWVGDVIPTAGSVLVFPDTASQKTTVNNFANNTTFSNIIITGEDFAISGNPIQLSNAIESHNKGNIFGLDIKQTKATSIFNRADLVFLGNGTAVFTVDGKYNLNGFDLGIFNAAQSSDVTLNGIISDSSTGAGNITSIGQGTTTFSAANTYRGITKVASGRLAITHSQALGLGDGTTASATELGDWAELLLKNNIHVANEFLATSLVGNSGSMALTSEGNNRWSGKIKPPTSMHLSATSGSTLQLDQDNQSDAGYLLYISGGGKTVLKGANYLFNSANVSGSGTTLEINGTLNAPLGVDDGASLLGSGSLGEVTILNGGTLSPGSTLGKMTVSKLNLNTTSTLNIEIGGTTQGSTYDWLEVTGTAVLNGTLNVSTAGVSLQRGEDYRFLTYASSTSDFSQTNLPSFKGQTTGQLSKTNTYYELSGRYLFVTNTNDTGAGSLRSAITLANQYSGQDEIYFALPSNSSKVINLVASLPAITGPTLIDARTEVANKLVPSIALKGSAISGTSQGLVINGSDSIIAGFAIGGFTNGIEISGNNNRVIGNLIGLDLDENTLANANGIVVTGKNNRIGTGVDGEGNIISGNNKTSDSAAVLITSSNAIGNRVQGNRIGTNKAGLAAVKNSQGVAIKDSATQNIVGTDGDGTADSTERNLISGNGWGVNIENGGTQNNRIAGNWIGLNNDGTGAIPNTLGGVVVAGSNNLIGTNGDGNSDQLERNVISGNSEAGIRLSFGTGTRIAGNYIGTNAAGTAKLGNNTGVLVTGATGAIIGTNSDTLGDSAEGNVISGNSLRGILISGSGSDGAIIAGNFIGTDPSGTIGLGNLGNGIAISSANQVRIGTDGSNDAFNALERNVVSNNGQAGIEITGGTNVSIAGNIVGLKSDGTTPLGNALEGILIGGGSGVVIGTDGNNVRDTDERNIVSGNSYAGISIYGPSSNIVVAGNYIGTDSQGTVARGNGTKGVEISGTSTNIRIGSLNDGINEANERNVISGNNRAGISTIVNGTVISGNYLGTDASGTTDVGNKENGIFVLGAVNTTIRGNIISGNDLTGIDVASSNSTIIQGNTIGLNAAGTAKLANTGRGIDVRGGTGNVIGTDGNGTNDANEGNIISGNSQSGIRIYDDANSTRIAGNRIGTDSAGSTALANSADGIRIETSQSTLVGTNGDGTSDTLERNIISGNTGNGITGDSAGVKSLVIAGNYIGTSLNGLARTANEGSGIALSSVSNAVIGGTLAVQGNLISGNNGDSGIHLNSSPQSVIKNNIIGLNATGNSAIGQPNYGIRNHFSNNTQISSNNISGNGVGMLLYSSNDVTIAGNFIGLAPDGVNSIPNTYSGITAQECQRMVIGTRGLDASTSNGNYIAGNGYQQIRLDLCIQNVIAGNSIGVGVNGQAVIGGITGGSLAPYGILAVSSTDLRIGTDGSADGFNTTESNVIGGNAKAGIYLVGTVATPDLRTIISGNYVGVTPSGEKRANGIGIVLSENNKSTLIGTNDDGKYDALESNVVSGNTGNGIELSTASDIVIAGNIIGLKPDGQTVQGNGQDGISIGSSSSVRVGTDGDNVSDSLEKNVVSGNAQAGINIWGSSSNVVVAGNMVGTNSNGTAVCANSQTGIAVTGTSQNIRIGALADGVNEANERNIVSGNHTGIFSGAKDVTISGNYVGTDATGQIDLGNSFWGIRFEGANNNLVRNNVISGNNRHGIETSISTSTKIQGNIIGLTATGNAALGNSERGIDVRGDNGTIIGTDGDGNNDANEGNIISSNGQMGVWVLASATGTRIAGNKIGTNTAGTGSLGNTSNGISILASTGTIVGTNGDGQSDALEGNIISGNQGSGITVGTADAKNVVIAGNRIGTTADGLGKLANNANGISFDTTSGAIIGGSLASQRNIISGNNADGIFLNKSGANLISNNVVGLTVNADAKLANVGHGIWVEEQSNGNTLTGNIISGNPKGLRIRRSIGNVVTSNIVGLNASGTNALGNTEYGIALEGGSCDLNRIGTNGDGTNDAAEGNVIAGNGQYNIYMNFAFDTTIAGNYIGLSADGTTSFPNSATIANIQLIDTTRTRIGTDSSNDQFNEAERNYIAGSAGAGIAITGTDPTNPYRNNESLIAGNVIGLSVSGNSLPNLGPGIKLSGNVVDTRIGSDLNGTRDTLERNTISGNQNDGIYLSGSGVKTTSISGNYIGTSLDGTAARGNKFRGIYIEQSPSVLVSSNIISGNESHGLSISGATSTQIIGNKIGTQADGIGALPNTRDGIYIFNGADQTTIGGTSQASRNIIAHGASSGIVFSGAGSQGSTVLGNYIGINATGTGDSGNAKFGILVENSPSIVIGGTSAGSQNTISGNDTGGVAFVGGLTTNGKVEGNYIGTDPAASLAIGNGAFGVFVGDSSRLGLTDTGSAKNVTIGGTTVASRNIISGNAGPGVWLAGVNTTGNIVSGNYIGTNLAGNSAIPNNLGILISNRANSNMIGGIAAGTRNLISGNSGSGIRVIDSDSINNTIRGNWIGINAAGTQALKNGTYGLAVDLGASATLIVENTISGNLLGGILLGSATSSSTLKGNLVGTDPAVTKAIGNGSVEIAAFGLSIAGSSGNTIGGELSSDRNIFAGNYGHGLQITDTSSNNIVIGNSFGTNANGTISIPNTANGILLEGSNVKNNQLGGINSAQGNLLYFNTLAGIRLIGTTSGTAAGNSFNFNSFNANGSLAIDTGEAGPTKNDSLDVDGIPNAPVIATAYITAAGKLVLEGYSRPGKTIQFYTTSQSSNGRGQGNKRLYSLVEGSASDLNSKTSSYDFPDVGSDAVANLFRFEIALGATPAVSIGDLLTAVAVGSTSEFGNIIIVSEEGSNQAPTVTLAEQNITVKTGQEMTLSGSFIDLDSTNWTATVNYGDGSQTENLELSPQRTFNLSHIFRKATATNSPRQVLVTVTDDSGMQGTAIVNVTVLNEAPVITASSLSFNKAVNEGGVMTLSGAFTDTGTEEAHTVVVQWGDGTTSSLPVAAGVSTFQTTHVYADDNPTRTSKDTYNFAVTVSDEGGLSHSVSDLTITEVSNVRPYDFTIDSSSLSKNGSGVPTVAEGTLFTWTGSFKDPGIKDSHEVIVNWGDGTPLERIALPSVSNQTLMRTFSLSHTYANNPLAPATNYNITFELADDDEPTTPLLLTQPIAVTNVVPTINTLSLVSSSIDENGTASLSINFNDPGINDTHQVIIDWGDNSEPESITTLAGTRSLTGITHRYRDNNTGGAPYNISVKLADSDMPANTFVTSSIALNVANKAPTFNAAVQLYVRDATGQWTAVSAGTAINEGDDVRITGAFSDVSELDTHTVQIQWAAGETTEANVNQKLRTFEAIYKYRDDYKPGTSSDVETITITLSDDDGGIATTTSSVRVNNVAPGGLFIPKAASTTSLIQLTAAIVDPGEEVFTYSWKAAKVLSPTLDQVIEQGTAKDFNVTTSLYTGYTIKVTMYVEDDDLGAYTYVSTLLPGTNGDDNLTINSNNFAAGTSNLTIVSFAGSDVLNATSLDSSKNVVLDGGDGVDYLFGGSGNDTLILRSGDDKANYSAISNTGVGDEGSGFLVIPNEAGNDTYILVPNSTLTIVDRSGDNSLDFNRASFGIEYDLSRLNSLQFDTQEVAAGGHYIKAMGEFAGLIGSNFGDRLTGAAGSSIYGGGGADTLIAVSGSSAANPSQFFGGADADTFVISGSQLNYIDLSGDSGADIFTISAGTLSGIDFSGGADADIFNINGGTLTGIDFGGGADADIFNLTGNITFNSVDFSGDSGMDIFNIGGTVTGTIDFGGGADADTFNLLNTGTVGSIDFSGDSGADIFVIAGTVSGGIDFSGGADNDIFLLTGTVSGSIDLQGDSGADDFTITGTVLGGVDFGGGADADYLLIDGAIRGTLPPTNGVAGPSLRFQGDLGADELEIRGTITGGIDFGGGADSDIFTISGQVSGTIDFSGGADADIFTINTGSQTGGIDFSGDSGADELIIRGTVTGGIDFGGGADADTLLITGSVTGTLPGQDGKVGPAILFAGDSGADVLEIRTTINGGIDFGGGADADTLLIVGTVNNGIDFAGDAGADIFELRGTATGNIDFSGGADADIFVLNGTARASTIDFSGGADADIFLINTSATSGGIDFSGDSGSDVFEIRGTVSGSIDFSGGADADLFTITSTGTTGGINFEGDSGADEFNMRGTVTGSIDFGGGADADLFTITGTASGGINFEGDSGDDRLLNQGNTLNITFLGGEGKDIFRNDTSNLTNLTFYGFESPSRLSMGNAANDGNDLFANYGSGISQINFIGNNGADVLYSVGNNIGSINFIGDSGADVFIIEGTTIGTIDFSGGADADSFSISGSQIGSIDFNGDSSATDNGDDIFVNTATGQTDSSGKPIGTLFFSGLGGNDILRNDGEDWSEIIFVGGNGANGLQNNADDISLIAYEGGDDTDTLENNGHNVSNMVFVGKGGNDIFVNDGNNARHMIYFGGQGDDQFLNTGANADGVQFIDESGSNRLVNTGSNAKNFYFQGGDSADTLLNKGAGAAAFFLYGNAGIDRFLNDTTATSATNIQLLDSGAVGSITWPFSSSPPFTLPSIPTPVIDDSGDIFINKGASSSNLRFEGGVGNDFFQNQAANVTAVTYLGGAGNDNGLNTSEGSSLTNFTFQGGAGNDAFQNDGTTTNNLTFHGEADNDSFYQNGTYAGTIEFFAGDGTNVFVNWGSNATTLRMTGGAGADRFQNNADNIKTIEFNAGGGINALQNNGDNLSTISMIGGSDADTLINIGNYVTFIDFTGQAGPDSLINSGNVIGGTVAAGTANTGIKFTGGTGQDALRTQGVGLTTLSFIGGSDSDSLIYNTVSGGTISYDAGTGNDGFVFRGNATSIDVNLGAGNDRVAYLGEVTSGDGSSPNVVITGGDGDDNYEFSRYPKGYLQLTELYSGESDTSRDSLNFSSFLQGGISIDLASTNKQQLGTDSQFSLKLTSDSVMGIENVTGTQFDDMILGNDRPNVLSGATYATNKPTNPVAQNRATQWVYLDFTSQTNLTADENEYIYTADDKLAVIQGLKKAYYGTKSDGTIREFSDPDRWFNVRFVSSISDIPSNVTEYVTIRFNETPPNGYAGGLASEIDYGNLNMGGIAVVQIHGLLGGTALPPVLSVDGSGINGDFLNPSGDGALTFLDKNPENTVANFIALSIKVSAHELGHLLGLRHYDAFGPIGSGVHSPPGSASFNPDYSGLSEAYETFQHLISSPASVGSDRNNDIGNLFFGEREAIKLAFAMSDSSVTRATESPFAKSTPQTAQPLAWSTIRVPNTLSVGVNANQNLYAETLSLTGKIALASNGKSEKDFYSFAGKAGDMLTLEVGSRALRRYTNPGDLSNLSPSSSSLNTDSYIDSTLKIYDSQGNLIPYYTTSAYNDDEFESTDSILLDLVLPSDDTYRIEVGSFTDTDIGNYELFAYRFKRENKTDGTNTLVGLGGADTLNGSGSDNYNLYFPTNALPSNAQSTETTTYTANIPFVDAGGYSWQALIEYGDGSSETKTGITPSSGISLSHAYGQNGAYTVKVTLSNDDNRSVVGQFVVTVANVAPTATIDVTGKLEGSATIVTMTGSDTAADIAVGLRYKISTTQADRDAATYSNSSSSNSASFVFTDNGTYNVYMRVIDADGGFTDYDRQITVDNVAPTISIKSVSTPRNVGKSITITAEATDPAKQNDVITYYFQVTRGGAVVSSGSGIAATHTFTPTAAGSYIVSVYATDEDGGTSTSASSNFDVTLEEILLDVTPPQDGFSGVAGQLRNFEFSASSLNSTSYSFVVDWKDGSALESFQTTAANQKITIGHRFLNRGKFSPTVTVTDSQLRTKSLTMNELTLLAFETQGSVLAIGASDGGSENDAIIVEAQATAGKFMVIVNNNFLSNLPLDAAGTVMIYGGAGTDSLSMRGTFGADQFRVTSSDIVLNTQWPIRGDSIESRELLAQAGNDQITVAEITTITLNGGDGTDTLIGPNLVSNWDVREAGGGILLGIGNFTNFENLSGGSAMDRFIIRSTGQVPGTLDGGAGENVLDYSLISAGASLNLSAANPTGTNVSRLVDSFTIAVGGSGADNLIGSANRSMILIGNAGADRLTGGAGADILIGGTGADTSINGGAGQDIVVGGRISFDSDFDGLLSVRSEWIRTDAAYTTKVDRLLGLTGGGLNGSYVLQTSPQNTLPDDSAVDTLFGGTDLDWFIAALADVTSDFVSGVERKTQPKKSTW